MSLHTGQECHKSIPVLDDQNKIFWEVYTKIEPGFIKYELYDYSAIQTVFYSYPIPKKAQEWIMDRILILIYVRDLIIQREKEAAKKK